MERQHLKNVILAMTNEILDDYSHEDLLDIIQKFEDGAGVQIVPEKPIDLDCCQVTVKKLMRVFNKPQSIKLAAKPLPKQTIFPNLFTVSVPIIMDTSKLSARENQILSQNLDEILLINCSRPCHANGLIRANAKIGIGVKHLTVDQKEFAQAKTDFITMQSTEFFKSHVQNAYLIFMPMMMHVFYKNQMIQDQIWFSVPP